MYTVYATVHAQAFGASQILVFELSSRLQAMELLWTHESFLETYVESFITTCSCTLSVARSPSQFMVSLQVSGDPADSKLSLEEFSLVLAVKESLLPSLPPSSPSLSTLTQLMADLFHKCGANKRSML